MGRVQQETTDHKQQVGGVRMAQARRQHLEAGAKGRAAHPSQLQQQQAVVAGGSKGTVAHQKQQHLEAGAKEAAAHPSQQQQHLEVGGGK